MAVFQTLPWHAGEEKIRTTLHSPEHDNPTVPAMSPQLSNHLQIAPMMAVGTLDQEGRPWTTLWGGEKGFARPLGGGIVGIRTQVMGKFDPVVEELVGTEAKGEVVREEGQGRMVSGLTLDLETRKRVKMYGRMIAGALGSREDEVTGHEETIAEVQLVLKVEQSLGNCPKYLNTKHLQPAVSKPELVGDSAQLSQRSLDLIEKADLFFISSAQHRQDMDTNHRGGPAGFVRVLSNEASGAVFVYPEYSGNRLYQTLGNLAINPLAGVCFPDFDTGDMLYLTGHSEILIGPEANAVLPRSNLAVQVTVTAARHVATALPFRGAEGPRSPYNPPVRYLAAEKAPPRAGGAAAAATDSPAQQASLLSQTPLTPSISRFRFALANPATYTPGQYVTLDFSPHLDIGYSHMRDDDPQSINDDFVRTFTVSSRSAGDTAAAAAAADGAPEPGDALRPDEFEMTIRKVGPATGFLFAHQGSAGAGVRPGVGGLEVAVKGFGGEFEVRAPAAAGEAVSFIAAGVGITPLLPSLGTLDYARLRVLWAVRAEDLPLVLDTLRRHPGVGASLLVFVTGARGEAVEGVAELEAAGAEVFLRRMGQADVEARVDTDKCYLCTGVPMRKQLMEWLKGKELIFEDFNF